MKDTDQIAAELVQQICGALGMEWKSRNDLLGMAQSYIEKAREVWLMEQSEHIKTGAVESRAAHSSPAEVRASEPSPEEIYARFHDTREDSSSEPPQSRDRRGADAIAYADADFVLRWLKQCESPLNIIGLQERVVAALSQRPRH